MATLLNPLPYGSLGFRIPGGHQEIMWNAFQSYLAEGQVLG